MQRPKCPKQVLADPKQGHQIVEAGARSRQQTAVIGLQLEKFLLADIFLGDAEFRTRLRQFCFRVFSLIHAPALSWETSLGEMESHDSQTHKGTAGTSTYKLVWFSLISQNTTSGVLFPFLTPHPVLFFRMRCSGPFRGLDFRTPNSLSGGTLTTCLNVSQNSGNPRLQVLRGQNRL